MIYEKVNANTLKVLIAKNSTSSTIPAFTTVKIAEPYVDASDCPSIAPCSDKNDVCAAITIKSIAAGDDTTDAITSGIISGINTSGMSVGAIVYPTTGGGITNNPKGETTIQQELGCVLKAGADGAIYVSELGRRATYINVINVESLNGVNAIAGQGESGGDIKLTAGKGDGYGNGGDIDLTPGVKGEDGANGRVLIKQPGTTKAAGYLIQAWHDGANGFIRAIANNIIAPLVWVGKTIIRSDNDIDKTAQIEIYHDDTDGYIAPKKGSLKTNNKNIDIGTGEFLGGSFTLSSFTASSIVETDADKKAITAAKKTAYNKDFGTAEGTVCQGNDERLSDARPPSAGYNKYISADCAGATMTDTLAADALGRAPRDGDTIKETGGSPNKIWMRISGTWTQIA